MDARMIVTREEWVKARKQLLAKEKELSKQRDALAAERRALPAVRLDKRYDFEGPSGKRSLAELFDGQPQLIVYHFMLDPEWTDGCKSCSFLADNFDANLVHLRARDTAFVAVSRAPLAKITAFQKRMGWSFPWYSSFGTDFNHDLGVTIRPEEIAAGTAEYNYAKVDDRPGESPGLSVFLRDGDDVLHTYSTYARGLDPLIGTYQYLDLTPLGRHEEALPYGMAWVRHHDRY